MDIIPYVPGMWGSTPLVTAQRSRGVRPLASFLFTLSPLSINSWIVSNRFRTIASCRLFTLMVNWSDAASVGRLPVSWDLVTNCLLYHSKKHCQVIPFYASYYKPRPPTSPSPLYIPRMRRLSAFLAEPRGSSMVSTHFRSLYIWQL